MFLETILHSYPISPLLKNTKVLIESIKMAE